MYQCVRFLINRLSGRSVCWASGKSAGCLALKAQCLVPTNEVGKVFISTGLHIFCQHNFLLHLFVCVGVHKGQRNTLQEPALSFYFVDLVDWWQALLPPEYLLLPLIIFGDGVLSVLSR